VTTFQEHPKKVLLGRAPRTLTTLDHRLELFARHGIAHTVVLTFDEELRRTPAEVFARELMVGRVGARSFVLGFDSKFGEDRRGTPQLLREMSLDVTVVPQVVVDGRPVSSTAIREAVELGDLEGAARMLGRRVSVFGEVVRGEELGRQIGFPTANLDLHHELHPPPGVYACVAHVVEPGNVARWRSSHRAACNIGFRPTVAGERPATPLVEVHLLDFEGDLYGELVELEFVARIRPERRFPGLEALKAQITRDVAEARAILSSAAV
jgi:riboflavin kinase/FMN adenylyltransferase